MVDMYNDIINESMKRMSREEETILEAGRLEVVCPYWASFTPEERRRAAEREAALIRIERSIAWN